MRQFEDHEGRPWVASVGRLDGGDYKGRYLLTVRPAEADPGDEISLDEVRWNSRVTADRTLATMSDVELRRRLRSARGRAPSRFS